MKLFSHPEQLAESDDDIVPEPARPSLAARIRDRLNAGRHASCGPARLRRNQRQPDDEQPPTAVEVDSDEPVVAHRRPARIGYAMGVLLAAGLVVVGVVGVASSPIPTVQDLGPAGGEPVAPAVPPDLLTPPAAEPPVDPGAGVIIPVEPAEPVAPTSASPRPRVVLEIPLPTPADVSAVTTPTTGAGSTVANDPIGSITPTDPSATAESSASTDAPGAVVTDGSSTEYGSDGTDDGSTASDGSDDTSDDSTDGSDTESDDQADDVPDDGSDDVSDEPIDGSDRYADDSGDPADSAAVTGTPGTTVSPIPVDPTAAPAAVGSTSSTSATESCSTEPTTQSAPRTPTALPG